MPAADAWLLAISFFAVWAVLVFRVLAGVRMGRFLVASCPVRAAIRKELPTI
jgi:hypothetical protein